MKLFRLILRGLAFRWRIHAAVAAGVMTATAVLVGALVVGDSVRGSLRHLALSRLGRIDDALVVPGFFRTALADEAAAYRDPARPDLRITTVPAILIQATLAHGENKSRSIAGQVTVLGSGDGFWTKLGDPAASWQPAKRPGLHEIVLNQPLADKLVARVGDDVFLSLPRASDIPAESALGRKKDTVRTLPALRVVAIIPAEGLGGFSLRPNQQSPFDAFVAIETLQKALDQPGRANAMFATIEPLQAALALAADELLKAALQPKLTDYGLALEKTSAGYFNFTTDRMLLDEPVDKAAQAAFGPLDGQATLTYLANYILAGSEKKVAKIPYSTVTGLDIRTQPPLGPFLAPDGKIVEPLGERQIVVNSWVAADMAKQGVTLKPGDTIRLQYFQPESLHGLAEEETVELKLAAIAELAGAAADKNITPELKGVTDRTSIANWDPPFKFEASRVRSRSPNNQDELYWDQYRALPKAFVSLQQARHLWSSRFGRTTSWRIPAAPGMTVESLTERLKLDPAALGFKFMPLRQQALAAAAGSTQFNELFLAFSFFLIAAAVMLVALLFKLGIDGRADEIGLLLAVGFSRRRVRAVLLGEGLVVSLIGGLLGILGGLAYAWLMIVGLRTWWLAAIVTPFLQLFATPESLAEGFTIGVVVSLVTIAWSLRQLRHLSVRQLLAGDAAPSPLSTRGRGAGGEGATTRPRRRSIAWSLWLGLGSLVAAVAIAAGLGHQTDSEAQAGVFFSSGSLVLIGLLLLSWHYLRRDRGGRLVSVGRGALARLAVRNGALHPLRSTLTVGLVAAAAFVIVAVSAFRLSPASRGARLDSGDGGFRLMAQSDSPIYQDLNTNDGRNELAFSDDPALAGWDIVSYRVHSGDDASCLNLFQARQPRVLGVPPALVKRGGFAWSASAAKTEAEKTNPWLMLDANSADAPVPIVMDEATATYALHLDGVGSTLELTGGDNRKFTGQVVGLLQNSIFQGNVLMSEAAFRKHFPNSGGYRFFLIDTSKESKAADADIRGLYESTLGDYGFDIEPTEQKLAQFMAVQNTYLSTFQSLGGLGLLLGTIGLAIVQLRSVLERRGELALLRATGFRRGRLATMVMLENAALLLGGLAIGIAAALVSILPQLAAGGATVPWVWLLGTLALVLIVGLAAGLTAVRSALGAPLIPALRGE